MPGRLAYPGMLQFFGGHIEEGEDPTEAIIREMGEETNFGESLRENPARLALRETVEFAGKGKLGEPVSRTVNVFHLRLSDGERIQSSEEENTDVVIIPATKEGLDEHRTETTAFAINILEKIINERNQ